jgi:hypothetical protein
MSRQGRRRADTAGLLDFGVVERRLHLGTRLRSGRREVALAEIVGSVNRSRDFDARFRPRTRALRGLIRDLAAARPDVADLPIALLQVDHAYFVEDGHKRLAIAAAAGRTFIDADVDRFETRFHVDARTTRDEIEATHAETSFREVTGLDRAAPGERFPLSDRDCYLELAESIKAHSYDLSRDQGRVVSAAEAAEHWLTVVFRPVIGLARSTDAARLLDSATDADLFLLFRRGISEPMDPGWQVPASAVSRGLDNVRAAAPSSLGGRLRSAIARPPRGARLLDDEADVRAPGSVAPAGESVAPASEGPGPKPESPGDRHPR